jgi:murein L,D-transpeptidase YafK
MRHRYFLLKVACLVCAMIIGSTQAFTASYVSDVMAHRRQVLSAPSLPKADQIVVYKSKRMLYLMKNGRILTKYRIALGKRPVGHKLEFGDYRTPEGKYTIDMKNDKSSFFLSLRVSYPDGNDADVASALETDPGDWIMIHGLPNDRDAVKMEHPQKDWTNGCIAVTNAEMADIWRRIDIGTPITIWP